ncbi:hypothetical protein BsWGS_00092 [Bradybaena similaris]
MEHRITRRPVAPHTDDDSEIVQQGEALFTEFVFNEIEREEVELRDEDFIRMRQNLPNPIWAQAGRDLRQMADEFARTDGRRQVQQRALQVGVNVTKDAFTALLTQLFAEGGVTAERIVVLFYFCSDIAINALRTGRQYFRQFFTWSLNFIADSVCQWVRTHGGWGQVLRSQINSTYKACLWLGAATVLLAGCIYFKYM